MATEFKTWLKFNAVLTMAIIAGFNMATAANMSMITGCVLLAHWVENN